MVQPVLSINEIIISIIAVHGSMFSNKQGNVTANIRILYLDLLIFRQWTVSFSLPVHGCHAIWHLISGRYTYQCDIRPGTLEYDGQPSYNVK